MPKITQLCLPFFGSWNDSSFSFWLYMTILYTCAKNLFLGLVESKILYVNRSQTLIRNTYLKILKMLHLQKIVALLWRQCSTLKLMWSWLMHVMCFHFVWSKLPGLVALPAATVSSCWRRGATILFHNNDSASSSVLVVLSPVPSSAMCTENLI